MCRNRKVVIDLLFKTVVVIFFLFLFSDLVVY